ncbi:MAG: hypothetical protein ACOC1K_06565 [Nanoarchaeota archaeon]
MSGIIGKKVELANEKTCIIIEKYMGYKSLLTNVTAFVSIDFYIVEYQDGKLEHVPCSDVKQIIY